MGPRPAGGNHDVDVTPNSARSLLEQRGKRVGELKLNLKRSFARSMTEPDLVEAPPPSPRSAKRRLTFVMLAGVLAIVGALAAGYYFAVRPVTLRIAVGPPNSDDIKVVQALTQAFTREHSQVRLRP